MVRVHHPDRQAVPLVVASPHSGRVYPPAFLAASALDPLALRQSEDAFVDLLFDLAPSFGIPLLEALFPRAYVDVNREPFELDPGMFSGALPMDPLNSRSTRVAAGLGTVPKVVAPGQEIYREPIPWSEIETRLAGCYRPYHEALSALIEQTVAQFGMCLLIDVHSMPSRSRMSDAQRAAGREPDAGALTDIVVGDFYGASSDRRYTNAAMQAWRAAGYSVARNMPYAGGYVTRHYGAPRDNRHVLQIEINRALYMDEATVQPTRGMAHLQRHVRSFLIAMIAGVEAQQGLAAE